MQLPQNLRHRCFASKISERALIGVQVDLALVSTGFVPPHSKFPEREPLAILVPGGHLGSRWSSLAWREVFLEPRNVSDTFSDSRRAVGRCKLEFSFLSFWFGLA